jgi:hypothetical protein
MHARQQFFGFNCKLNNISYYDILSSLLISIQWRQSSDKRGWYFFGRGVVVCLIKHFQLEKDGIVTVNNAMYYIEQKRKEMC